MKAHYRGGKKTKIKPPTEAISLLSLTRIINDFYRTHYRFDEIKQLMDNEPTTIDFILAHKTELDTYMAEESKKEAARHRKGKGRLPTTRRR